MRPQPQLSLGSGFNLGSIPGGSYYGANYEIGRWTFGGGLNFDLAPAAGIRYTF